jgi:5-methyltetrahydropteroyltriglutamate--homocysteine methyltransferase
VLTIENSRSGDAMVSALAASGYGKDLGPGVYDVHSPQVKQQQQQQQQALGILEMHISLSALLL